MFKPQNVRVTLGITVDLEPMLRASIRASKRLHLGTDEVTEHDLQRAREVFAAHAREERPPTDPAVAERIRKGLPAGIAFVELLETREGSTSISGTVLDVSDLSLLPSVVIDHGDSGQPPAKPFEKFVATTHGNTVTLRGTLDDPSAGSDVEGNGDAGTLFSAVKIWLKLELPSKPLSHNAGHGDGNTLVWELVLGTDHSPKSSRESVPIEVSFAVPA